MPRQPKNQRDDVLDKASKPPARKAKTAAKDVDEDYEDDEDLDMEQLAQKVKEAKSKKKQGDNSEDYRKKFKEHVEKRQAEALATLLTERKRMMDEEDKADAELDAIIRTLKEAPGKEQHRLYIAQQSLCALTEKILDVHKPVQHTIKSALDKDLKLGEDWEQAGNDAAQVINLLKQEYENKVEKELSADTKGDKTNPGIGQAGKQTEKAVRKIVKTIHIPEDDDDETY